MSSKSDFSGSAQYIASLGIQEAVRSATILGKPLLVKGPPGVGKTRLAEAVAAQRQVPLHRWTVKSTTLAQDGRFHYDKIRRLADLEELKIAREINPERAPELLARIRDLNNYTVKGKLWLSFEQPAVLLVDEIDKADPEFPNDLLEEFDEMRFDVPHLEITVEAKERPLIIITSNNERDLPDAFLRRVVFCFIPFPEEDLLRQIVRVHLPDVDELLLTRAIDCLTALRSVDNLKKKPATAELLDWLRLLSTDPKLAKQLQSSRLGGLPFLGAVIKDEVDQGLLSQARR